MSTRQKQEKEKNLESRCDVAEGRDMHDYEVEDAMRMYYDMKRRSVLGGIGDEVKESRGLDVKDHSKGGGYEISRGTMQGTSDEEDLNNGGQEENTGGRLGVLPGTPASGDGDPKLTKEEGCSVMVVRRRVRVKEVDLGVTIRQEVAHGRARGKTTIEPLRERR